MPHNALGPMTTIAFIVVKSLILVMGGVITYFAYKAYRRTRHRSLGFLAAGFGTVTLGALLGGVANEIFGTTLIVGIIIEGIFVLIGFTLIAASLRVR